jgi:hypothetical protein
LLLKKKGAEQSWRMLMPRTLMPRTLMFAVGHFMAFANAGAWLGMSKKGQRRMPAFKYSWMPRNFSVMEGADAEDVDCRTQNGIFT